MKNNKILIIGDNLKRYWFKAFFGYSNRENMDLVVPNEDIEKWNNKEYKYLLDFYDNPRRDLYEGKLNEGKTLIENKEGKICVNKE